MLTAPPLSRSEIIRAAEDLISSYTSLVGRTRVVRHGLRFEDVYEAVIYPEFEIEVDDDHDLGLDDHGQKILGRFDVLENRAHIDRSLKEANTDPRRTFTLYHEVAGHGILHAPWLRHQFERLQQCPHIITSERAIIAPHESNELERQANLFAANAAAPMWLVRAVIAVTFRPSKPFVYLGPTDYCLDVRGRSVRRYVETALELCRLIATHIKPLFGGLSVEALSYRVFETGLIVDAVDKGIRLHRVQRSQSTVPRSRRPSAPSRRAIATGELLQPVLS